MLERGAYHGLSLILSIKPFRSLIRPELVIDSEQCGHPAEGVVGQELRQQWEEGPFFQPSLVVEPVDPACTELGSDGPPVPPPS